MLSAVSPEDHICAAWGVWQYLAAVQVRPQPLTASLLLALQPLCRLATVLQLACTCRTKKVLRVCFTSPVFGQRRAGTAAAGCGHDAK